MLDLVFGLSSAVAFGVNSAVARRGVLRVSANYLATVSILSGPVFFLLVSALTGDLFRLAEFPWKAYLFFALGGIVHFVMGRTFAFRSIQLMGSARAAIIIQQNTIISVILAILVLGETLTSTSAIGIALSLLGLILIAFSEYAHGRGTMLQASHDGGGLEHQALYKGLLYGAGTALFWGSSSIFVKLGLENGGSSIAGTLTAYVAASLAISPSLLGKAFREELAVGGRKSLLFGVGSGLATNLGQMFRYAALAFGPVITVSLMLSTQPFWIMLLAFLFNRKLESLSRWVVAGNSLVMIGAVLVILGETMFD